MVCVMMRRSEMQVLSVKFWSCSPISVHAQVLDLVDLAAARAQTSAQTAAEHINLRSINVLWRQPQARTAAVKHLPSAPSAHPVPVWRARATTKTRDYRTFESARLEQTTCAPAHQ